MSRFRVAMRDHFWGEVLPLPTSEWNRYSDVLATTLPRADWQRVRDYYTLAEVANENPQDFIGSGGAVHVRDLRDQLEPALRTLSRYLQ